MAKDVATVEDTSASLVINDTAQKNNILVQNFSDVQTYTVIIDDGRQIIYSVDIVVFTGLPIIYISTIGNVPINSEEDYIDGTVDIKGGLNFSHEPFVDIKIRGLGNSTWFFHPKNRFK